MDKPIDVGDFWTPAVTPFISNVPPKRDIKIGFVGSERLFYGLKDECDIFPVLEGNWKALIDGNQLDFILVESCLFTFLNDWRYALSPDVSAEFSELIASAKIRKIPVVFWFSQDVSYFDLFANSFACFDSVFVSDIRALEKVRALIGQASYLPPAVQPRLFNPLRSLNLDRRDFSRMLVEGGKSLENTPPLKDALRESPGIKATSFERSHVPPENYFTNFHVEIPNIDFRGKLSHRMLPEVLKHARLIISSPQSRTSNMERQWRAIENAACLCPSVFIGSVDQEYGEYISCVSEAGELTSYMLELSSDSLEVSSRNHENWREIYADHTFEKRLASICEFLGVGHSGDTEPLISVITPTMRPDRFDRILENFRQQTYSAKELIVVVNGSEDDFAEIKKASEHHGDIKICYMPADNYAASSLNYAAKFSSGIYVFRFDDDDYYGASYLKDTWLMLKAYDAEVIGKFAPFVKTEGDSKVYIRSAGFRERNHRAYSAKDIGKKFGRISGATFGIKRSLLDMVPFPDLSLVSADTAFLEKLRTEAADTKIMKTDSFNFTIGRQPGSHGHTWKFDTNKMEKKDQVVAEKFVEVPR